MNSNLRPYAKDEPTNHLDVMNVKWVEEYLLNLKNVTCIIVSHDTGLLDRICNNIIAIDTLKLKQFRGWGAVHHLRPSDPQTLVS